MSSKHPVKVAHSHMSLPFNQNRTVSKTTPWMYLICSNITTSTPFTGKHSRCYWRSTKEGLKWIKVTLQSLDFRLQQLPRAFILPPASLLESRTCNFPKGKGNLPLPMSQIHLWCNFIDGNGIILVWSGINASKSGYISDGFYSALVQAQRSFLFTSPVWI